MRRTFPLLLALSLLLPLTAVGQEDAGNKIYGLIITDARPSTTSDRACHSELVGRPLLKGQVSYRNIDLFGNPSAESVISIDYRGPDTRAILSVVNIRVMANPPAPRWQFLDGKWHTRGARYPSKDDLAAIRIEGNSSKGTIYFESCHTSIFEPDNYSEYVAQVNSNADTFTVAITPKGNEGRIRKLFKAAVSWSNEEQPSECEFNTSQTFADDEVLIGGSGSDDLTDPFYDARFLRDLREIGAWFKARLTSPNPALLAVRIILVPSEIAVDPLEKELEEKYFGEVGVKVVREACKSGEPLYLYYRGVSLEEAEQIDKTSTLAFVFGYGPENGKYLTNTKENADEWGQKLNKQGHRIAEILVPQGDAEKFKFLGSNWDFIGPAWFAQKENLKNAHARILP